jgi:Flp pilus assembly protein TadG
MTARRSRQRGNTLIEFTLVGIPLIFVLISIFEMARGMWIYHSLQHAVKEGARFAIVHGINCTTTPNACGKTVGDVARIIQDSGVGLIPGDVTLTFASESQSVGPCVLTNCLTNTTAFPSGEPGNLPGRNITITGTVRFQSAAAYFWPGARGGFVLPAFNLPASARDKIQF